MRVKSPHKSTKLEGPLNLGSKQAMSEVSQKNKNKITQGDQMEDSQANSNDNQGGDGL